MAISFAGVDNSVNTLAWTQGTGTNPSEFTVMLANNDTSLLADRVAIFAIGALPRPRACQGRIHTHPTFCGLRGTHYAYSSHPQAAAADKLSHMRLLTSPQPTRTSTRSPSLRKSLSWM